MTSKEGTQRQSTLGCPYLSACLLQAACLIAPPRAPCNRSPTPPGQAFVTRAVSSFPGALSCHPGPLAGTVVGVGTGQHP